MNGRSIIAGDGRRPRENAQSAEHGLCALCDLLRLVAPCPRLPASNRPPPCPSPAGRGERKCLSRVTVKGKKANRGQRQKIAAKGLPRNRKKKKTGLRTATNRDISCHKTAIVNRKVTGRNMLFQDCSERTRRAQSTGFVPCAIFCGPPRGFRSSPRFRPHWSIEGRKDLLVRKPPGGDSYRDPTRVLPSSCPHPALILPSSCPHPAFILPSPCSASPRKTRKNRPNFYS